MPRGQHLSIETRKLLVNHVRILRSTIDDIYKFVFFGDSNAINRAYLTSLCNTILTFSASDIEYYELGPDLRGGHERKLSPHLARSLCALRKQHNQLSLTTLNKDFCEINYEFPRLDGVSISTVSRTLKRSRITPKKPSVIPVGRNPIERLAFMDLMGPIDSMNIIDMDCNLCSRDKLVVLKAWSSENTPAYVPQDRIELCGYFFSIISAYTCSGFLCWSIYDDIITSLEVVDFINYKLAHVVSPADHLMCDNASNFKTLEVRQCLETAMNGQYIYKAPYSFDYSPCEKGISLVVAYLRKNAHECHSKNEALNLIEIAFTTYSVSGELGHTAHNHFNIYARNNEAWLNDF